MINVAQLLIKISASAKGLERELASASKKLANVGRRMQNVGMGLTKSLTIPLMLVGGVALKAAGDFDQAMTHSLALIGNVSQQTRREMETTARAIAKESSFGAAKAAEAYYFLASAGISAKDSIAALPKVVQFAEAGHFDLARATELLMNSLSQLELRSEDAGKQLKNMVQVSDALVMASSLANGTVEQFAEALAGGAGKAAVDAGQSLEDVVTVLAKFAAQGKVGAEAATLYRQATVQLAEKATKNADAFDYYRIKVFEAGGAMRDMTDIGEQLAASLGEMSDEARAAAYNEMGIGVKARQAINLLMGLRDMTDEWKEAITNAGGKTEDVASKELEAFNKKLAMLKNQFNDVAISLGQSLMPIFERLVVVAKDVALWLDGVVKEFGSWSNSTKDMIIKLALLLAAIGPITWAIGGIIAGIGKLIIVAKLLFTLLAAHPILLFAAALGALALAFYRIRDAANEAKKAQDDYHRAVARVKAYIGKSEEYRKLAKELDAASKVYVEMTQKIESAKGMSDDMSRAFIEHWQRMADAASARMDEITAKLDELDAKERESIEVAEAFGQRLRGAFGGGEESDFFGDMFSGMGEMFDGITESATSAAEAIGQGTLSFLEWTGALVQALEQTETWNGVWRDYANSIKIDSVRIAKDTVALLDSTISTFTRGMGNAFAQTLVYGKSFSKGMKQMGAQMAASFISNLVDMGMQLLIHWILSKTILAGLLTSTVGTSAGKASAGAAAWAHVLLPPPLSTAMAAVWGPAAAAQTMAMGSFGLAGLDQGGLTTGDGIAMLHKNEIVGPFEKVERMLAPGTQTAQINFYVDSELLAQKTIEALPRQLDLVVG